MKITKAQIRKIIREAVSLDAPLMWKDEAYTVTERKPSRHKGVQNGKPMELVIWKTLKPSTGTPGMGSMDIPQGMGLEEFFEAGEKEGFPDYYKKPETGADMNRAIKAAEERGDWDDSRRNEGKQMKITKGQLRRTIRQHLLEMPTKAGFHMEDAVLTRVNTQPDEYDASIELFASIFGDDEAVIKIASDFGSMPDDVLSPANLKWQQGLISDYKRGKIRGSRDWRGLLKSVPEDLKRKVFPYEPSRDVRKKFGLGEFAKEV